MNRPINGHTVASKAKVSVSVDRTLLREADRLAGRMTRSQIFEHALAAWVRQRGQAEQWQRAQAWATWQKIQSGDRREVSDAQVDAVFDRALTRSRRRAR